MRTYENIFIIFSTHKLKITWRWGFRSEIYQQNNHENEYFFNVHFFEQLS